MNDDARYASALDHTDALEEELSAPEPDWPAIRAHADAIGRIAREQLAPQGAGSEPPIDPGRPVP